MTKISTRQALERIRTKDSNFYSNTSIVLVLLPFQIGTIIFLVWAGAYSVPELWWIAYPTAIFVAIYFVGRGLLHLNSLRIAIRREKEDASVNSLRNQANRVLKTDIRTGETKLRRENVRN